MEENNKNQNKTVCITGAGGGIGRAIAIEMNIAGYNVACADINLNGLNKTLELLNNNDLPIMMVDGDCMFVDEVGGLIDNNYDIQVYILYLSDVYQNNFQRFQVHLHHLTYSRILIAVASRPGLGNHRVFVIRDWSYNRSISYF